MHRAILEEPRLWDKRGAYGGTWQEEPRRIISDGEKPIIVDKVDTFETLSVTILTLFTAKRNGCFLVPLQACVCFLLSVTIG